MNTIGTIRRIAATAVVLALTFLSCSAAGSRQAEKGIDEALTTIKSIENADVINFSKGSLFIAKLALRFNVEDEEDKLVLKLVQDTDRMTLLDYSSCVTGDRTRISEILAGEFKKYEQVMEIKDDGETLSLYAAFDEGKDTILDVLMFIPEDCSLIRFKGKYDLSMLAKLIEDE
ncbi:MAG: DUF4252 domain-containing protein [Candidatus Cryptobacteroides sp.]